ncbi:porin family protein [Brumimicrobium mesophilum]|uniref:porin family protein n=1 Tax=Brumimicrobium mesophilum TaxID=392717 RepID=UPI000D1429F7|nr:porin family protein [Brumimicrobium mesophilum]
MLKNLTFILLLGLTFLTPNLFSQKFSLGIIGGLTSSQISGDGIYGFAQFGGIAGADVNYPFNETWSATFGLQFNQKGARNYQSQSVYSPYRLRVNYVEAPLVLNYHFNKFKFNAGLYLGVKVNQNERNSFGLTEPYREFKSLDIGLQLGVNYEIKENWQLELRFQNSIFPVRDHILNQAFPPALFIVGDWHQKYLNKGQFFTSLSLTLRYEI